MATVRVSTKGQIVIPAEMRRRRGLTPGSHVSIEETDQGIVLRSTEELIRSTRGMLRHLGGKPLTQELLEERRRDLELEEARFERLSGSAKRAPKEPARPSA
jgi:AbrB family looped-hinge helix DNA binding protein